MICQTECLLHISYYATAAYEAYSLFPSSRCRVELREVDLKKRWKRLSRRTEAPCRAYVELSSIYPLPSQ